ncbi:hypothetical protein EW026_g7868 [Hermanssonia centrifuga]|uniref:Uncharacterized protein n=1 Tax=Hermanssonia centrifuga TaxID=98765 RepID=A0A4S4K6D8_9APHY|nr:hypothetical protein EW026_g7868 [Hermanssonia centrifuga]
MARLHAIALDLIFQAIFPQAGFLNPSLSFGPEAPWARALRTKKALTLVCKFWQGHALPYLYSDIVIRHVGQLPALARTIRSAPGLYGCLVKSLKILCEITYYPYKAFARNSLIYIFQHCPNLRALSISYAPMIWKLLVPDLFLSVSIGL